MKDHHDELMEEQLEEQREELNELHPLQSCRRCTKQDRSLCEKFERTHYAQDIIDNFDSLEGQKRSSLDA